MPHQVNTRSLQRTNSVGKIQTHDFHGLGQYRPFRDSASLRLLFVAGAFRDLYHLPVTMPRFETLTSNEAPTHGMDYCHTQALPTATQINSWLTMNNLEPATLFKLY